LARALKLHGGTPAGANFCRERGEGEYTGDSLNEKGGRERREVHSHGGRGGKGMKLFLVGKRGITHLFEGRDGVVIDPGKEERSKSTLLVVELHDPFASFKGADLGPRELWGRLLDERGGMGAVERKGNFRKMADRKRCHP